MIVIWLLVLAASSAALAMGYQAIRRSDEYSVLVDWGLAGLAASVAGFAAAALAIDRTIRRRVRVASFVLAFTMVVLSLAGFVKMASEPL